MPASRSESLCSLNFAARARSVELGKATARHDTSGEIAKAKAEAKKALDSQRAVIADLAAAKSAAAAASEAETAARARVVELTSKIAAMERDAAAATDAHRELEALRAQLRTERDASTTRADEIERLKRELKEQVRGHLLAPHSSPPFLHFSLPNASRTRSCADR